MWDEKPNTFLLPNTFGESRDLRDRFQGVRDEMCFLVVYSSNISFALRHMNLVGIWFSLHLTLNKNNAAPQPLGDPKEWNWIAGYCVSVRKLNRKTSVMGNVLVGDVCVHERGRWASYLQKPERPHRRTGVGSGPISWFMLVASKPRAIMRCDWFTV